MQEFGKHSRRRFVATLGSIALAPALFVCNRKASMPTPRKNDAPTAANVYRSINGSPAENFQKIIELAGGIENIIGIDDVVIIKPNLQWWNQGVPNIAICKVLVEMIMDRPGGFAGEVVIGENTHRGNQPWTKTGWATPFAVNSDLSGMNNYNELCVLLKKTYGKRFSISHWIDVAVGGKRVFGPQDGPGYVYCDGTGGVPHIGMDNGLSGTARREVIMSYPVFTTDNGTIVDFKNGVWRDGTYTGRQIKFINLAALNHHSTYCGMTSSIKNYFGITDISNGADPYKAGKLTGNYYNFHAFAYDEWAKGPAPGIMGAEIGMFMQKVRKADLNIITAEWVGMSSRTDTPVSHTRAVLASTDPVALDFHASKYILFPNSQCRHHDPDWQEGPLFNYLQKCADITGFVLDEQQVKVISYDFAKKIMQTMTDMSVYGTIKWGSNVKALAKYFIFRFGNNFLS